MTDVAKETVPGSGLPGLDTVLRGFQAGDNVVFQVDSIDDYLPFVTPFARNTVAAGRPLIYFRFSRHAELLEPQPGLTIHRLNPEVGFETFTAEIHKVIEAAGLGAYYVFDSLSDLAADWCSDLMVGNFFRVTCPYLYELDTVTYFAILRGAHTVDTVATIRGTTQLMLDVFRHDERLHLHPLKVHLRHSPTMYLPHAWVGDAFVPLTESAVLSDLLSTRAGDRFDATTRVIDTWDRKFVQAREVTEGISGDGDPEREALLADLRREVFLGLVRMMVARDERIVDLAERYLSTTDLLDIRRRLIGTGLIGGKSAGMLLARAILAKMDDRWRFRMEAHDSFYIGADVFYTYLVRNGCWRFRRAQRVAGSFREGIDETREKLLSGDFPPFILEQFVAMLEYFGQSPIIVRSSSLLEDSFGNAFTGKYESVFCPNQGSPDERLEAFLSAVRTVYASTVSTEALQYRAHRGLIERDEQMAILVQRVSGAVHGHLYFPQAAGVALSYNPYAWHPSIDPQAGVVRLVFGLGTRAVDRSDDDYTRMVALNDPLRRPEAGRGEIMEFAQRRVDVIDLVGNRLDSSAFDDVVTSCPDIPVRLFAVPRADLSARAVDGGARPAGWVLTFDRLLKETTFVAEMREMLATLRDAYDYPVDVEFTANFLPDGGWRLNIVQCRPLQVREGGNIVPLPDDLAENSVVLDSKGPIIGPSSATAIDRIVYVVPRLYDALPIRDRYTIARLIGRITHLKGADGGRPTTMLLGPGRWGTSTPSLGVPVSFAEINTVSVIGEIIGAGMNVVPDVSLGTHFFNDLVEANMLFLAVQTGRGDRLEEGFFLDGRNLLPELLPDDAEWAEVVRVVDAPTGPDAHRILLNANSLSQRAVCYLV